MQHTEGRKRVGEEERKRVGEEGKEKRGDPGEGREESNMFLQAKYDKFTSDIVTGCM